MRHCRRMRSKSLCTTQAHRELDHFKPIQDGKGFGLIPLHFEAESGAWTLALMLEDWTIGISLSLRMNVSSSSGSRRSTRSIRTLPVVARAAQRRREATQSRAVIAVP